MGSLMTVVASLPAARMLVSAFFLQGLTWQAGVGTAGLGWRLGRPATAAHVHGRPAPHSTRHRWHHTSLPRPP